MGFQYQRPRIPRRAERMVVVGQTRVVIKHTLLYIDYALYREIAVGRKLPVVREVVYHQRVPQ